MIRIKKGNVVLKIDEKDLPLYLKKGYAKYPEKVVPIPVAPMAQESVKPAPAPKKR